MRNRIHKPKTVVPFHAMSEATGRFKKQTWKKWLIGGTATVTLLAGGGALAEYMVTLYEGQQINNETVRLVQSFVQRTNTEIKELELKLKGVENTRDQLQEEVVALEGEAASRQKEIQDLNNQIAELKTQKDADTERISLLEGELAEASENLTATQELLQIKEMDLAEANHIIGELRNQIETDSNTFNEALTQANDQTTLANKDVTQTNEKIKEIIENGEINQPSDDGSTETPEEMDGEYLLNKFQNTAVTYDSSMGEVTVNEGEAYNYKGIMVVYYENDLYFLDISASGQILTKVENVTGTVTIQSKPNTDVYAYINGEAVINQPL